MMDIDSKKIEEFDLEDQFGLEYKNLFSSPEYVSVPFVNRGFCIPKMVIKNGILFIGLNPSYTLDSEPENQEFLFYDLHKSGNYKYFKKFESISAKTGISWTHIDLLAIRETNQNSVKDLVGSERGKDLIWKNLEIAKSILEKLSPKIIVVSNSLARTFLGKDISENKEHNKWLEYRFEFDERIGTDRIANSTSNLNGTPTFFTSMLTGQRALDNGSFDRLNWHIKYVLDKENLL